MKKYFLLMMVATFFTQISNAQISNFYELKATTIDGKEFKFSSLKGKKVIIVNTASKCGFTPQYEKLESLYKKYQSKGLVIIGFPSNDFLNQEPGSNEDIQKFCSVNYGVTFPMMSKIKVTGDNMHPVYKWLTDKNLNGKFSEKVSWNFQKFLIDEKGVLVKVVPPRTSPDDPEIIRWLEGK
ncbi:MAG TPA: glutathione peroxidase [Bacteroidia bacterium]|nr:glutathione peroxidase [Bacteroidia bacterium]HRS58472.1 glutathione peroxidase [Bacteroidia bacterium]HRU68397.1 glutathione peroxidase [Bacteroidia bacterium]